MFFRRKKDSNNHKHEQEVTIEVEAHKKRAIKTAEKAKANADQLNRLLRANGITLKIFIAAGGRHS